VKSNLATIQVKRSLLAAGEGELSELERVFAHQSFQEVFIVLQG
jgi:hypothetical protein